MKKTKKSKTNLRDTKKNEKHTPKNKKQVVFDAVIATTAMFLFNILLIPENMELSLLYLNKSVFYTVNVLLAGIVYYSLSKNKYSEKTSKYTFLFLLITVIISGFFQPTDNLSDETIVLFKQIIAFKMFLLIPMSTLGSIAILQNKDKLINLVDNLFQNKKEKYSPFSKKELPYTLGLFAITVISVFTLFYRLDNFDLYSDEAQVTQGAAGYYHTGKYEFWDFVKDKSTGIKYDRAKPHLFTVAQSYKLFGINTWSSRFPSAVFGIIMLIAGYFIARFFIKDKTVAILSSFSFVFYFEFLFLQRWTRMYAMLFPVFLILFYATFRFFTEPLPEKYKKNKEKSFLNSYIDFNYILLPVLTVLLVFALSLHINSAIIMAVFFIFIIFSIFLFKEKKYVILAGVGILIIISQILYPSLFSYRPLTFFEANNANIYTNYFFAYPVDMYASVTVFLTGIVILITVKNKDFRQKYLSLYLAVVFSWAFFSYIVNFAVSFRYMSFIAPLAIFTVTGMLLLIARSLYGKIIQSIIVILIVISILVQFLQRYNDLYVRNFASPAKPSVAWRKIIDNYQKGEIIFKHWGPMMYFDDLDTSAIVRTIGSGTKKKMSLGTLLDSLKNHKSGWLTWNTHNSYALNPDIPDYCNLYFDKLSGYGIDKSGVEIFRYTDSMLVDINIFNAVRYMPCANLNTANDFSVFFFINADKNVGKPLLFYKEQEEPVEFVLYRDKKNIFAINLPNNVSLKSDINLSGNWHSVIFTKKEKNVSLFIDGKQADKKTLKNNLNEIVKFKINPLFKGQINDIRIYDTALNQAQINIIINNFEKTNPDIFENDNKKSEPLFRWKKNNT